MLRVRRETVEIRNLLIFVVATLAFEWCSARQLKILNEAK